MVSCEEEKQVGKEETPKTNNCVDGKLFPFVSRKLVFTSSTEREENSDSKEYYFKKDGDDGQVSDSENKKMDELEISQSIEKKPTSSSNLLFSEEDEVILLTELQDFRKKQDEVKNDWVNFHLAIKGKLSQEYSKTQVSEKVRRLKKKFKRIINKSPSLPLDDGAHEACVFQLSKSLWENDPNIQISSSTSMRKRKKKKEYVPKGEHVDPLDYPLLRIFFSGDSSIPEMLKNNWTLIGSEAAEKLENQWAKLFQKQLCLNLEEINFKVQVCTLILDQIKRT